MATSMQEGIAPIRSRSGRRKWRTVRGQLITYVFLLPGAVIFAFPFYWMITSSLKSFHEVYQFPPKWWPSVLTWTNYSDSLQTFPFVRSLANTLIIVAGVELGQLLSVPIAGYAFARLRFPFKRTLFAVLLGTMILPYYVTLIPQYVLFQHLGWLNTYLPLVVPSFLGVGGPFFIFMFRQFCMAIPKEYDEAAMLDGCGRLRIFFQIILPQTKPVIIAMMIYTFLFQWNDFFGPLIYLTSSNKYTLALNFEVWQQTAQGLSYGPQPFNKIMAIATLITVIPIAVFFLGQRHLVRGLVVSGIKD